MLGIRGKWGYLNYGYDGRNGLHGKNGFFPPQAGNRASGSQVADFNGLIGVRATNAPLTFKMILKGLIGGVKPMSQLDPVWSVIILIG